MYSAYASSTTTMQGASAISRSISAGSVALPVGLFGLQCQMIFAPTAAARMPSMSGAKSSLSGTRCTVAPICSETIGYIE